MADKGWIKTYRKIQECWIWLEKEPFDKRRAWIDWLLTANHADKKILFNGELITVRRGQILTSIRKLAEKWKWSYDKVLRFLRLIESDGMIKKESDNFRTLLTIENYEVYQDVTITDRTPTSEQSSEQASERTSDKQEFKELKNVKNERNNKESALQLFNRLIADFTISVPLAERMEEWIVYKSERKQTYKETGLKTLLKQVAEREQAYGSIAIMDLIDECMARNYSGIIWDRLKRTESKPDFVDMWRNV